MPGPVGNKPKPAAVNAPKPSAVEVAVAKAIDAVVPGGFGKVAVDAFGKAKQLLAETNLNVNPRTEPLASAKGRIPESAWIDATQLVSRMTQNSDDPNDPNSDLRCGPTNLLAAALLQGGPSGAAKLVKSIADRSGNTLLPDEKNELKTIAARIKNHTATFDDLSRAQNLMYAVTNTRLGLNEALSTMSVETLSAAKQRELDGIGAKVPNLSSSEAKRMGELLSERFATDVKVVVDTDGPGGKEVFVQLTPGDGQSDRSGLDEKELRAGAKNGGLKAAKTAYDPTAADSAEQVLKKLKPGESVVLPLKGSASSAEPDHFVSVGVLKDGRPYIYNPDPQQGDATLTVGYAKPPQARSFETELAKYSPRSERVR